MNCFILNPEFIFYIGLALFLTHQLDAIRCHEWRLLPGLRHLEDGKASRILIVSHIPVLVILLWFISYTNSMVQFWFQAILDVMFMGHLGKHILWRNHENNEFNGPLSKIFILFTALAGLFHLILLVV